MSIISNSCTFVKEQIKFGENFEYELLVKVTKTGGGVNLFSVYLHGFVA